MVTRVLHLVGSPTSEFHADLSRLYAQDCLAATATDDRYAAHIAYVSPGGTWRFPADLRPPTVATTPSMTVAEALQRVVDLDVAVVLPQMFCPPGMTAYRSLFDVLGVPYVGNPAEVMALGLDKAKTRAVVSHAGVAVPDGEVLGRGETATLEPPVVIKPVASDNSLGVTLARRRSEYAAALGEALRHDDAALVERYVELGREVRCGVIEQDGALVCLPLEEYRVDPADKPIRVHADKLARDDGGRIRLVAKDAEHAWILDESDPVSAKVWSAARTCFRAMGCRDYGLFDFRIDPAGDPWFLEAGLYCSFAPASVVAVMAAAAGITLPELFAEQVARALDRGPT